MKTVTQNILTDMQLSQISEIISDRMGLHFTSENFNNLERGLFSIVNDFKFKDINSCIQWVKSNKLTNKDIEILARHLTVGETYFFREKTQFNILENQILPELIKLRQNNTKTIRIWSAGCCSGEEPYSIAILLHKLIPDINNWNISILGTDINPRFLKKAEEGIYSNWSFRESAGWIKDEYFKKIGDNQFEINSKIKKMVKFSYLNLVEDIYPSLITNTNAIDILFCRNVLMYFNESTIKNLVKRLFFSLSNNGWFFVSSAETNLIHGIGLQPIHFGDNVFYRKPDGKSSELFDVQFKIMKPYKYEEKFKTTEQPQKDLSQPKSFLKPNEEVIPHESKVSFLNNVEPILASYNLAFSLFEQGQYEKSINELLTLISNDTTNHKSMMLLSKAFANIGQLETALDWNEKGIKLDKTNKDYHFSQGTILQELGKIDEATSSYMKVLYLDPDLVIAHFALATLAKNSELFNGSKKHFRNALNLLNKYKDEDILEASDGISAGRLREIILSITNEENLK